MRSRHVILAGLNWVVADIRAYSGAVRDVIYDAGRVELKEAVPVTVTLSYDQTGKI